jgi:hypothetical protein
MSSISNHIIIKVIPTIMQTIRSISFLQSTQNKETSGPILQKVAKILSSWQRQIVLTKVLLSQMFPSSINNILCLPLRINHWIIIIKYIQTITTPHSLCIPFHYISYLLFHQISRIFLIRPYSPFHETLIIKHIISISTLYMSNSKHNVFLAIYMSTFNHIKPIQNLTGTSYRISHHMRYTPMSSSSSNSYPDHRWLSKERTTLHSYLTFPKVRYIM